MWRIVLISLRRATVEETSTSGNNAMPAVGVAEDSFWQVAVAGDR